MHSFDIQTLHHSQTKLAQAFAGEARAAFISVAPSDILSKFVGESEASVREIFLGAYAAAAAVESKCAVLFFDEIDAIGKNRGAGAPGEGDGCSRRVLAELLLQLNHVLERKLPASCVQADDSMNESFDATSQSPVTRAPTVVVIAATNRPEDCDSALLRRFGNRIYVGLPSARDRIKMVKRFLVGIDHVLSIEEIADVAEVTEGWSGSDIESLTREAAMAPIRECIKEAALLRKRIRNQSEPEAFEAKARLQDVVVSRFQSLRPVCFADFEKAADFMLKNTQAELQADDGELVAEYDSSSDEDL